MPDNPDSAVPPANVAPADSGHSQTVRLRTSGVWRTEFISDACRVVVGIGRQKLILARLATKQIPEAEVATNACLMAAAKDLYDALVSAGAQIQPCASKNCGELGHLYCAFGLTRAALKKARGNHK